MMGVYLKVFVDTPYPKTSGSSRNKRRKPTVFRAYDLQIKHAAGNPFNI